MQGHSRIMATGDHPETVREDVMLRIPANGGTTGNLMGKCMRGMGKADYLLSLIARSTILPDNHLGGSCRFEQVALFQDGAGQCL
jgi:hypothetical protein